MFQVRELPHFSQFQYDLTRSEGQIYEIEPHQPRADTCKNQCHSSMSFINCKVTNARSEASTRHHGRTQLHRCPLLRVLHVLPQRLSVQLGDESLRHHETGFPPEVPGKLLCEPRHLLEDYRLQHPARQAVKPAQLQIQLLALLPGQPVIFRATPLFLAAL